MSQLPDNSSPSDLPQSEKQMSSRQMRELIRTLDLNEEKSEQNFVEQTRPQIFGNQRLNWDGVFHFFSNLVDNILWKLYGGEVSQHQARENKKDQSKTPPHSL